MFFPPYFASMDVDEDFEMASASSDHRMCPPTTSRGRGSTRGGARGRGRGYQPGFSSCATSSIREDVDLEAVRGRGRGGGVRGGRGGRGRPPCVTPGYTANERLKNRKVQKYIVNRVGFFSTTPGEFLPNSDKCFAKVSASC